MRKMYCAVERPLYLRSHSCQRFITTVFQVHLYDVVIFNTFFFQMLTEEVEKQIRLTATSHTRNNFYHPIVLTINEFP